MAIEGIGITQDPVREMLAQRQFVERAKEIGNPSDIGAERQREAVKPPEISAEKIVESKDTIKPEAVTNNEVAELNREVEAPDAAALPDLNAPRESIELNASRLVRLAFSDNPAEGARQTPEENLFDVGRRKNTALSFDQAKISENIGLDEKIDREADVSRNIDIKESVSAEQEDRIVDNEFNTVDRRVPTERDDRDLGRAGINDLLDNLQNTRRSAVAGPSFTTGIADPTRALGDPRPSNNDDGGVLPTADLDEFVNDQATDITDPNERVENRNSEGALDKFIQAEIPTFERKLAEGEDIRPDAARFPRDAFADGQSDLANLEKVAAEQQRLTREGVLSDDQLVTNENIITPPLEPDGSEVRTPIENDKLSENLNTLPSDIATPEAPTLEQKPEAKRENSLPTVENRGAFDIDETVNIERTEFAPFGSSEAGSYDREAGNDLYGEKVTASTEELRDFQTSPSNEKREERLETERTEEEEIRAQDEIPVEEDETRNEVESATKKATDPQNPFNTASEPGNTES